MGTDAFVFFEHRAKGELMWHGGSHKPIILSRNYRLFDAIGGGRSNQGFLIPPRGYPDDISEELAQYSCSLIVSEDVNAFRERNPSYRRHVFHSSEVDDNYRVVVQPNGNQYACGLHLYDKKNFEHITWLSTNELQNCFDHVGNDKIDDEWKLMLNRMFDVEQRGGSARLVIWFNC